MEKTTKVSVTFNLEGLPENYSASGVLKADNRTYNFVSHSSVTPDIQPGSLVLVETQYGLSIVQVVAINVKGGFSASRPIIAQIDIEPYQTFKKKQQRIGDIQNELEEIQRHIARKEFFKMIAEKDEHAKELVKELEDLGV